MAGASQDFLSHGPDANQDIRAVDSSEALTYVNPENAIHVDDDAPPDPMVSGLR
jgi:hypothetical protein